MDATASARRVIPVSTPVLRKFLIGVAILSLVCVLLALNNEPIPPEPIQLIPASSSVQCSPFVLDDSADGLSDPERECRYTNLVLYLDVIYYIDDAYTPDSLARPLPNVRRGPNAVNGPWDCSKFRPTRIKRQALISHIRAKRADLKPDTPLVVRRWERALIWCRLFPANVWHSLMEDLVPLMTFICRHFGYWSPACYPADPRNSPLILLMDPFDGLSNYHGYGDHMLPSVIEVTHHKDRNDLVIVREVGGGSGSHCNEDYHCKHRFREGELAAFRAYAMRQLPMEITRYVDDAPAPGAAVAGPAVRRPHILFVHRTTAREIIGLPAHIDALMGLPKRSAAIRSYDVVDVGPPLTTVQQCELYNRADILISVTGAAMSHVLFARPNLYWMNIVPVGVNLNWRGFNMPHLLMEHLAQGGYHGTVEYVTMPGKFTKTYAPYEPFPEGSCMTRELYDEFQRTGDCRLCEQCVYHLAIFNSKFNVTTDWLADLVDRAVEGWHANFRG